jgi:hypothetical protein
LGRVPVSAAVVHALDTFIKDWRPSKGDGPLFLNNHGDEFSEDGWSSMFRRIKSRLPRSIDFKLHGARNTALTNWHRAGWTSAHWATSQDTRASSTPNAISERSRQHKLTWYTMPSLARIRAGQRRHDLSPAHESPGQERPRRLESTK